MSVFILLGTAGALAFSIMWMALKPLHAVCMMLGLLFLETALLKPIAFEAGILFYPADIFFLIITGAFFMRMLTIVKRNTVPYAWWIVGLLQFFLFCWGLALFGKPSGVDYRGHFYAWIAIAYFSTVNVTPKLLERATNIVTGFACAFCLLIYYRWSASALDPVYARTLEDLVTTGIPLRVVGSSVSLLIAFALCGLLYKISARKVSPIQWLLLPIFALTVIGLQHRSVWVSLFSSILCLIWATKKQKQGGKTAIGIVILVIPLLFVVFSAGEDNSIVTSVKDSAGRAMSTQEGTMVGRASRWNELVENWIATKDPVTYLVGKPYGGGYASIEYDYGRIVVDYAPHNHFVHVMYRGGLIGLGATLYLFYLLGIFGVRKLRNPDKTWSPYFLAVFAALLAFYIPYWMFYWNGIFLGMAINYLGIQPPGRYTLWHPEPGSERARSFY